MTNLLTTQKSISEKYIKSFGITEIFVIENELYTTSNYSLTQEMIELLENELLTL